MIYIVGIIAIIGIIGLIVSLAIKTYKIEQQEQDDRMLQLEKRLQKNVKNRDDELVNIYDNITINNDEIKELQLRLQKLERKIKVSNDV